MQVLGFSSLEQVITLAHKELFLVGQQLAG